MSAISDGTQILLSGPPHNTKAVLRIDTHDAAIVSVRLDVAGKPTLYSATLRAVGPGSSELRLQLPRETPPGEYRGEVVLDETTHPLIVHVVARHRTRISPKQVLVEAEPGGRAEFDAIVSNDGNVPAEIPKSASFDLDDGEGQDRALGVALRADLAEGEERVDRFFEELRRSHGGEARVLIVDGAGTLKPGESRPIRCRLEIPMTTEPGRSFIGAWQIGGTSHVVAVNVLRPGPRNGGQRNGGRKA
jgi:hypothetical protein